MALPFSYNQVIRWTADSKALTYLDRREGIYNIWKQPLDEGMATQITNFTEDVIFLRLAGTQGELVVSRGAKTRDIVLIRNF